MGINDFETSVVCNFAYFCFHHLSTVSSSQGTPKVLGILQTIFDKYPIFLIVHVSLLIKLSSVFKLNDIV